MRKGLLATVVAAGCMMVTPVAEAATPSLSISQARNKARSIVYSMIRDSEFEGGSVRGCVRVSRRAVDCDYTISDYDVRCEDTMFLRRERSGFISVRFPTQEADCYSI